MTRKKKLEPITLRGFIALIGGRELARRLGVDKSLPSKWNTGHTPKVSNAKALVELAKAEGYRLSLEAVLGGDQ